MTKNKTGHSLNSTGCPAVVTIAAYAPDHTLDGVPVPEACRRLEEAGAAVVGINCARGPSTMMPLLREVRKACKVCIQLLLPAPGVRFTRHLKFKMCVSSKIGPVLLF